MKRIFLFLLLVGGSVAHAGSITWIADTDAYFEMVVTGGATPYVDFSGSEQLRFGVFDLTSPSGLWQINSGERFETIYNPNDPDEILRTLIQALGGASIFYLPTYASGISPDYFRLTGYAEVRRLDENPLWTGNTFTPRAELDHPGPHAREYYQWQVFTRTDLFHASTNPHEWTYETHFIGRGPSLAANVPDHLATLPPLALGLAWLAGCRLRWRRRSAFIP